MLSWVGGVRLFRGLPAGLVVIGIGALIAWGSNPYAAMPSLHAMDALIVGVVMFGLVRSRIAKALWLAWPVWVGFAVISTGNHYWLDVVAGFVLAVATGLALRRVRMLRLQRA